MVGLDQEFTQEIPGVPMYHSVHVRSFKHLKKRSFIIFSSDVFFRSEFILSSSFYNHSISNNCVQLQIAVNYEFIIEIPDVSPSIEKLSKIYCVYSLFLAGFIENTDLFCRRVWVSRGRESWAWRRQWDCWPPHTAWCGPSPHWPGPAPHYDPHLPGLDRRSF